MKWGSRKYDYPLLINRSTPCNRNSQCFWKLQYCLSSFTSRGNLHMKYHSYRSCRQWISPNYHKLHHRYYSSKYSEYCTLYLTNQYWNHHSLRNSRFGCTYWDYWCFMSNTLFDNLNINRILLLRTTYSNSHRRYPYTYNCSLRWYYSSELQ